MKKYKFLISCEMYKEIVIEAEDDDSAYDKAYEGLYDVDMSDGDESERRIQMLLEVEE